MVHTDGATSPIKARKGRTEPGQSLERAISYYDGCHQIQAGDEPANAALQPGLPGWIKAYHGHVPGIIL